MKVTQDSGPPEGYLWPPDVIPPQCEPQCGMSMGPVMYVVVWRMGVALSQPRINPATNLPEVRHIMIGNELWYFMNADGCWAHVPKEYTVNPHSAISVSLFVQTKLAPTHEARWRLTGAAILQNGGQAPGSIVMLKNVALKVPVQHTYNL